MRRTEIAKVHLPRRRLSAGACLARMIHVEYDGSMFLRQAVHLMVQVFAATFEGGVFKPDERPALSDNARVRLVVEALDANGRALADESWAALQHLWSTSSFKSPGDRLNRDQLHERR